MNLGFIGAGKMAEAILKELISQQIAEPADIYVFDKNEERLELVKKETGISSVNSNKEVLQKTETVFLCIKPQDMQEVLEEIKPAANEKHLFISIAAGITLNSIQSSLPDSRIVRVMPNTPCLIGESMNVYCLGEKALKDKELVKKILSVTGKTIELKEELMNAVTALSGSGPAFIAFIIDSLAEAGVMHGLERETALLLAEQTVLGTAKLLREKKILPEELIETVSSPGGGTEKGMNVLIDSDLRKVLGKAVEAAKKRYDELGKNA